MPVYEDGVPIIEKKVDTTKSLNFNVIALSVAAAGGLYLLGRTQGMNLGRAVGRTEGYAQATSDMMKNLFKEVKKDSTV